MTEGWGFLWGVVTKVKLATKTSSIAGRQLVLTYKNTIMVTIFIFEDNLLPVQSSLLKFSSWIEVGVSSMLVLARQTKSCVQVLHTYGEEEPAHCLKVLALVLPGLDTGRYV